ncbi:MULTISPECIES: hypothetical protein [unclassified Nocardia]|uniref:hypothetical protein n=1 Tax=unclassified Nocardia TaxID=2637762 RepID=UPI001CE44007|nr:MULTISPECIES: hypothetical protein [unclassified Nocardia]
MEGAAERFGRIVRSRRLALGMTQRDVKAAGGPSVMTQNHIENGTSPHTPTPTTLGKYDHVLRWKVGSASATFYGGEPTPLDAPAPTPPGREEFARLLEANPTIRLAARRLSELSDEDVRTFMDLLAIVEKHRGTNQTGG